MKSQEKRSMASLLGDKGIRALAGVLLLAALLFPMLSSNLYLQRVLIIIGVYAILALSLNIITGYAGIVSLGHAAFFSIGAYTAAILMRNGTVPFLVAAIAGAVIAAFAGLLLGLPTLRLNGAYLVMTTQGFAEVIRMITINWESVTNGALGIKGIPAPTFFGKELTSTNGGMYYLMLAILLAVIFICYAIKNSKMGRALRGIKDDELAVSMMGVNVNRYKVQAFVIGAAIAGFIGAFYSGLQGYIDPYTFTTDMSTVILCIVLLGGMGSIWGMLIAAGLLMSFPEALRFLSEYRFVVYGLLLIIMMRYRPEGLLGRPSRKPYKLPKGVTNRQGGDR